MTSIVPYSTIVIEPKSNNYNYNSKIHLFKVLVNTVNSNNRLNDIIYNDNLYKDVLTIIDNSIGIGITNPNYNLHVTNTTYIDSILGDGISISNINASNINSGTINIQRFPSILQNIINAGSSTNTVQLTVDSYGRITSVTNTRISLSYNQVQGLVSSAFIDTTNSSNISLGLIDSLRLPSIINVSITNISNNNSITNINALNILSGILPLSVLNTSSITSGVYGSQSYSYNLRVDSYGRITSIIQTILSKSQINATNITTGTFNVNRLPTISGVAGRYGDTINTFSLTVDIYGRVTSIQNNTIIPNFSYTKISGLTTSATIDTTNASNITSGLLSSSRINSFTALYLTGDGSAISSINLSTLNTSVQLSTSQYTVSGVVSGTYGSISNVVNFSIDKYGRITSVSNSLYSTINSSLTNVAFSNSFTNTIFPSVLNSYSISNSNALSNARGYYSTTRLLSSYIQPNANVSPSTDNFGNSVATSLNGSIYVIGSINTSTIYIYSSITNLLLKSYTLSGINFGQAVDISKDGTLIAVTSNTNPNQNLYIISYINGNWINTPLLICNGNGSISNTMPYGLGLSGGDTFGYSVAIIDNSPSSYTILVGTNSSLNYGKVYQFTTTDMTYQTWSLSSTIITTSTQTVGDRFGQSMTVAYWYTNNSQYLYGFTLIGSPETSSSTGSIYIFNNSTQIAKINGSDTLNNDKFGSSLTGIRYDNNISYVAVGVPNKNNNAGQVYLYYTTNFFTSYNQYIIRGFDSVSGDNFGYSLQFINFSFNNYYSTYNYNNTRRSLLIGAKGANSSGGKLYVYTLDQNIGLIPIVYYDFTYLSTSITGQQFTYSISKPDLNNKVLIGSIGGYSPNYIGGLVYVLTFQLYDSSSLITQLYVDIYGRITNTSVLIPPYPNTIINNLGNTSTISMNTVISLGATVTTSMNIGNVSTLYNTYINAANINLSTSNIVINSIYSIPKYYTGEFTSLSTITIPLYTLNFNICIIKINFRKATTVVTGNITLSGTNTTSISIPISNPQERYLYYSTTGSVSHTASGILLNLDHTNISEFYYSEIKLVNNNNGVYYYMSKSVYRTVTSISGTTKIYTSGYLNSVSGLNNLILTCQSSPITGTWTAIYN